MHLSFLHPYAGEQKQGFTLVETMITVSIYVIVLFAVFEGINTFYRYNAYSISQSYQVNNARQGMDQFVADVREMTYADDGTFPLSVMEQNKIGFYSDVNHDNSVEYVEYELSSTTLEKKVYLATGTPPVYDTTPDSTQILSKYVRNGEQGTSTFYYYDANGNLATASTTATDIVYVVARIIVNIDPARNPGEFTLRSSVAPRNLKQNQ